jgi:hypothetical protein
MARFSLARELIGFLLVALVFTVAFRIRRSIGGRKAQQSLELETPSASLGGVDLGPAFYVSTVFSNSPLERVWAHDLGSRGKCQVFASSEGVSIERTGERDFAILASQYRGITRESATIDKGVEPGGLVAIHWQLGTENLITNLRVVESQKEFIDQLQRLMGDASE